MTQTSETSRQSLSAFTMAIVMIGVSAIVTQTVLLREMLAVFHGNELVIGILLANWMILTGCGAIAGRVFLRSPSLPQIAFWILLLTALLPAVTLVFAWYLRMVLFDTGLLLGMVESFVGSLLLFAPFCMFSGCSFTLWAQIFSDARHANRISSVYSIESIGSVVGGIVFNVFLVNAMSGFQALVVLGIAMCGSVFLVSSLRSSRALSIAALVVGILFTVVLVRGTVDDRLRAWMHPQQDVVAYRDTPYGKLTVTRQAEQLNSFENGVLLASSNDIQTAEEIVHYAMVQHPRPARVLLIGGGMTGALDVIRVYNPERVLYLETDPQIIHYGKEFGWIPADSRIASVATDARRYLHDTREPFDVILVNTSDPITAGINRYFSREFMEEARRVLSPGGILSLSLSSSGEYQSGETRRLYSVLVRTIAEVFTNNVIIPGNRMYFIASDRPLTVRIAERIAERGLKTAYVNSDYLDDDMNTTRSNGIRQSLDHSAETNSDFRPVAYARQMEYLSSVFGFNSSLLGIVIALVTIAFITRLSPVNLGMFVGGCATASLEIVILLGVQIIYGSLYLALGAIVTILMAGLAVGSWASLHKRVRHTMKHFGGLQTGLAVYALILVPILMTIRSVDVPAGIGFACIGILMLIPGVIVGWMFTTASSLTTGATGSVASAVYSVDLVGSAIGVLGTSAVLIPALGMQAAAVIVGILCFAGAAVAFKTST